MCARARLRRNFARVYLPHGALDGAPGLLAHLVLGPGGFDGVQARANLPKCMARDNNNNNTHTPSHLVKMTRHFKDSSGPRTTPTAPPTSLAALLVSSSMSVRGMLGGMAHRGRGEGGNERRRGARRDAPRFCTHGTQPKTRFCTHLCRCRKGPPRHPGGSVLPLHHAEDPRGKGPPRRSSWPSFRDLLRTMQRRASIDLRNRTWAIPEKGKRMVNYLYIL